MGFSIPFNYSKDPKHKLTKKTIWRQAVANCFALKILTYVPFEHFCLYCSSTLMKSTQMLVIKECFLLLPSKLMQVQLIGKGSVTWFHLCD